MITRHHLALAMMCTLLICSVLLPLDLFIISAAMAGACAGAILPDFQMKKPKRLGLLTCAWLVAQFSKEICVPAMCSIYSGSLPRAPDVGDKRLTHSLPGVSFVFIVVAGITLMPVFLTGNGAVLSLSGVFLAGVILGMTLHLVEDLCTRRGISPLFPFSSVSISGSIRPCNGADRRIARFQTQHGLVLGVFLALHATGLLSIPLLREMCLPALCVLLGWMIYLSDVTLGGSQPPADHQGAASTAPPALPVPSPVTVSVPTLISGVPCNCEMEIFSWLYTLTNQDYK